MKVDIVSEGRHAKQQDRGHHRRHRLARQDPGAAAVSGEWANLAKLIVFSAASSACGSIPNRRWPPTGDANFQHCWNFASATCRLRFPSTSLLQDVGRALQRGRLQAVPASSTPLEAVKTNIVGPQNIVQAIRDLRLPVRRRVVGISTDKANR